MQSQASIFLTDEGSYVHEIQGGLDIYFGDSHYIIIENGLIVSMVLLYLMPDYDDNEPAEEYNFDPAPKYDGF